MAVAARFSSATSGSAPHATEFKCVDEWAPSGVVSVMLAGQFRRSGFHVARATIFASFEASVGHWKFGADDARNERHVGFYFVVRVAGERHAFGHGRHRRVLGVR